VSTVVHITAMIVSNSFYASPSGNERAARAVESRWSAAEIDTELARVETEVAATVAAEDSDAGGLSGEMLEVRTERVDNAPPSVSLPRETPDPLSEWLAARTQENDMARIIGPVTSGTSGDGGNGNGRGDGTGDGQGAGVPFFELRAEGRRFVYVVDGSLSMNHPYPGEYKTRFNRLKIEMARSISKLNAESEFFIIFFNDQAHPMPAAAMQPARSDIRAKSFQWLASVMAEGRTDPRPALKMALKMRPDVIYFLTDGEFPPEIARDLEKLTQREVTVHTFALANPDAEATLRVVAERNGGKYTFVP